MTIVDLEFDTPAARGLREYVRLVAVAFGGQTPLGRAAQPAELAPPYVLFASQELSYVTGEVLGVTGGEVLT